MNADDALFESSQRVLMTTDTVGGVWHYAVELSEGLCRRGFHVALAAMGAPPSDAQRAQVVRIENLSLHARPYRLEWMDDPYADLEAAGDWLQQLARSMQAELIHLNQFAFGELDFDGAPKLVVGHSSVTSWWQAVKREAAPASWDRYRSVVRRGLAGADLVAAPTHAMLLSLEHDFGPWCGESVVLGNGRDPSAFIPASSKEPIVFAAGRLWDEAKNLAALDRIAPALPWPLVVAGPTHAPCGSNARDAAHVRLLGQLSQQCVADWLGRASIFVHPAYYEPFGLSVLEAALAGCALVLGDIDSLREIWGSAACYARPDDDAAIARELRRLIDDAALRGRMACLAQRRALEFSAENMLGAYLDAYSSLLKKKQFILGAVTPCTS